MFIGIGSLQEAGDDNISSETTTVLEIGKRRPEYLSSDAAERYAQEAGCSGPKIARNDDCLEGSEHLLPGQEDVVYHSSGTIFRC